MKKKMRYVPGFVLSLSLVAAGAAFAQARAAAPTASSTPTLGMKAVASGAFELWQIDLNPSGTGFAVTKPELQGDVYVFRVWPDRSVVRLPKARVKSMKRRTKDIQNEVLYRIDLAPTGQMIARDNPVKKGNTYQFHSWKEGT